MTRARIAAVGAGRMGRGIAHVFAYAGHPVALVDVKERPPAAAERYGVEASAEIRRNLEFLASLDVLSGAQVETIMGRIAFAGGGAADAAMAEADIVFEAVPEIAEAKQGALARICRQARRDAVIASTTSTMLVSELSRLVSGPERFLNVHWLNPAFLMPLVEVSPSQATDAALVERLMALLRSVGKVPVRCKPSPGYIIPRLQTVLMNEAVRLVEEGVATAEDVDTAVRTGFGVRYATMGVIEFLDWGGVDILYYAGDYLRRALDAERFEVPAVVGQMMAEGRTGLREGRGFHDFRGTDVAAYQGAVLSRFVGLLRHLDLLPPPAPADD